MQRTIRVLRIALPIVFIAFLLFLGIKWTRTKTRDEKPAAQPVTSTQRPDDVPRGEFRAFEDTQTIGGKVVSRVRAKRVVSFESDWSTLEGVEITIFRPNSLTYELSCPQAQFNSKTKEADAKGGVHLTSTDGVEISTAEIKFDGNRLTNDIPVAFTIDRWKGKAGALDLDVATEMLKLLKNVDATMSANATEPPMTVSGTDALFRRRENDVTFTANARITRGPDIMTADRVAGRFTQDRRAMIGLEGNGNVVMLMSGAPAQGENLGGRKEIRCDRFFSEVAGDGQINAINAVGESGPAHAVLDGPPRRDITAQSFRIALANKAVSELKANNNVTMKESGDLPREITAMNVVVSFDPVQHRATSAFMDGNFKYVDARTTATAMRANYDVLNDRVLLTADEGFDPTVVSEGHTLKAKQIEFAPKAQTAKATGEVIAQLMSKGSGPSADSTNLFPAGRPVFVNADSVLMRQANKVAVFTGNVRAWQENNTLLAAEMQVQGSGQSITARGNVRTSLYNTAGDASKKIPVTSRSEQLVARRNERRIDMSGDVHIDDEGRSLTAEKSSFFFDANRKIERVEAEQKVVLNEAATGRKGTGDKAVYQIQKKLVMMTGSPATAADKNGKFSGEQIAFDLARNRVQVVSPGSQTQGTYKQEP
jgi:LPS export ABC transporter protein LptC/lipopolysaccharide transport protein LptA